MNETIWFEMEECTSTNDVAWEKLSLLSSSQSSVAILTNKQTKGRGRQGRTWNNAEQAGNLFLSVLFKPDLKNLSWLPLAAGVSAVQALSKEATTIEPSIKNIRLKWPNDLFIDQAKAGGILCESKTVGDQVQGAVVGIGMNLFYAPTLSDRSTEKFFSGEFSADKKLAIKKNIAADFVSQLLYWNDVLAIGSFEQLKQEWLKCAKLDQYSRCTVRIQGDALAEVELIGLDDSGCLICKDEKGKTVTLNQPLE